MIMNVLLPEGSLRRKGVKKIIRLLGLGPYDVYAAFQFERKDKIGLHKVQNFIYTPLISIVIPAYNTPKKYLDPLIDSIIGQVYDNWELIIVNASDDVNCIKIINDAANIDTRVRIIKVNNEGISKNTNAGIKAARGEYVAFMDHDDLLDETALEEIVSAINNNLDLEIIYSDEDKVTENGKKYAEPHFKPDWSPDLLNHVNYITHFTVLKRNLLDKIGLLDSDKDGAQDYDLILRATDSSKNIYHIQKVLYHWRIADNSTAQSIANKPYIKSAGERALREHFGRTKVSATVEAYPDKPGFYKIQYIYDELPTIIFTPFAEGGLLRDYINTLYHMGYLDGYRLITPIEIDGIENNNFVKNDGDYIKKALGSSGSRSVFVSDFIVPRSPSWAVETSAILNEPHVHAVAPVILRAGGIIEDMGLTRSDRECTYVFKGHKFGSSTYFGDTSWTRNVDALSGKVTAVRTQELLAFMKGKESISSADTLFNYSMDRGKGKFNTVWSGVTLEHLRSAYKMASSPSLFNANLYTYNSEFGLSPGYQQMVDSLENTKNRAGLHE